MRLTNREDVVQAALTVVRWCGEHLKYTEPCDCPFFAGVTDRGEIICAIGSVDTKPCRYDIEWWLRNKGTEARDDV